MQKRQLGNSDLHITPIGFGAWAIGGSGWAFAWGPQDDEQSIRSIHRALNLGINWIDTAAVYGLGHSEEVVARALQGRSTLHGDEVRHERGRREQLTALALAEPAGASAGEPAAPGPYGFGRS